MGLVTINYAAKDNSRPSQSGWNKLLVPYNTPCIFSDNDFTTDTKPPYLDPEGDDPEAIKITSLPDGGLLTLNGSAVSVDDEITITSLANGELIYTPDNDVDGYTDSGLEFTISDTGSNLFTLKPQPILLIVDDNINLSPTEVGNGEADVKAGDIYVFTRASLTSQLNPPYEDPEGDAALNLLIISVPDEGGLYYNNKLVYSDAIIPFSDIDAGLFEYRSDSLTQAGILEGFEFAISDAGSEKYRT